MVGVGRRPRCHAAQTVSAVAPLPPACGAVCHRQGFQGHQSGSVGTSCPLLPRISPWLPPSVAPIKSGGGGGGWRRCATPPAQPTPPPPVWQWSDGRPARRKRSATGKRRHHSWPASLTEHPLQGGRPAHQRYTHTRGVDGRRIEKQLRHGRALTLMSSTW